jgi:hypothetical protein
MSDDPEPINPPDRKPHEIARKYLQRGWKPVPIPAKMKEPVDLEWQLEEITPDNVKAKFQRWHGNVGVQFGAMSGGLTDVDLDCPETLALADALLPPTSAVFGRKSKRRSHWLYITELCKTDQKAVIRYSEPTSLAHDGEKATLVELRIGGGGKGAQTIFPGSTDPNGEKIEWDEEGEPEQVNGAELKAFVEALAVGALLIRHYPRGGARHDAALVLGGVLARAPDWKAEDIEHFVSAIARAAGDEEASERGKSAAGAVDLLQRGEPTPGLPRMREVWGLELTDTVTKWLNLPNPNAADHDSKQKKAKDKQALTLAKLAPTPPVGGLFRTKDHVGYADIGVNGHRETHSLRSASFRRWLVHQFYWRRKNHRPPRPCARPSSSSRQSVSSRKACRSETCMCGSVGTAVTSISTSATINGER